MEDLVRRYNERVALEARRQGVNVTDSLVAQNISDVLEWAVRGATQRLHNMKSNKRHNAELREARALLKEFKSRGKSLSDLYDSEEDDIA